MYLLLVLVYQIVILNKTNEGVEILMLIMRVVDLTCLLVVAGLWVIVESLDPADSIPCTSKRTYCALCNKSSLGLDHHCIWLNTCISAVNKKYFVALVTALFTQLGCQNGFNVYLLIVSPLR